MLVRRSAIGGGVGATGCSTGSTLSFQDFRNPVRDARDICDDESKMNSE